MNTVYFLHNKWPLISKSAKYVNKQKNLNNNKYPMNILWNIYNWNN